MKISILILTYNEQRHIRRCIKRAKLVSDDIVILDSHSLDDTVQMAQEEGVRVFYRKFDNYSAQTQFGISNIDYKYEFIARIDADEYFDEVAVDELNGIILEDLDDINGLVVARPTMYENVLLKSTCVKLLRIWRSGYATCQNNLMDEKIYVSGKVIELKGYLIDHNLCNVRELLTKHIKFAELEVDQLSNKAFLLDEKKKLYYLAPKFLRAMLLFLLSLMSRNFINEGISGFKYKLTTVLVYRIMVDLIMSEYEKKNCNIC